MSDFELAASIGLAAGMRTSAPPVAMLDDNGKAWLALLGELCVDKLPMTPARVEAGGLTARVMTALWGGFQLARKRDSSPIAAMTVAGVSAVIATNVMFQLRVKLRKALHVPDVLLAIAEDACVIRLITHIRTARGV